MAKKLTAAEADAVEFGRLTKQGGARQALLCARSVDLSLKGDDSKAGKMSATAFSKAGHVGHADTIRKNHKAWDLFAEANDLPLSRDLTPGQEVDFDSATLVVPWEQEGPNGMMIANFPTAAAGADYRVGGSEVAEKYALAAAEAGTTKGMAIRVGSNLKAVAAAITADPKVAEAARKALDKVQQQKAAAALAAFAEQGKELQKQLQAKGIDTTHHPVSHSKSDLVVMGEAMVEIGKLADKVTAIRDLVADAKEQMDELVSSEVSIGDSYIAALLDETSNLAIDIATSVQGIKLNQEV